MGLPLPAGVLYKLPHSQWPDSGDWSSLTDQQRMDRQWKAYNGLFQPPLRRTDPSEPNHNVIDNRCGPIVDTGVDFMQGDEIGFEVTKDDGSEDEEAQAYLDDVWEANVKMPTLAEYEINSSVFGHGFLKLDPDDEDTAPFPSISILPPRQMSVITEPYDVRKVRRYTYTYQDVDMATGAVVMRRELWEKDSANDLLSGGPPHWVIREQQQEQGQTAIQSQLSPLNPMEMSMVDMGWYDIAAPQGWDYPWAPIHAKKNMPNPNNFWGRSDLPMDLIHLNDALNFLLSNRQRILYYHGHPKPHYFGIHAREIDVTPSGAVCIPNQNARVQQIEMNGDLAAITEALEDIRESMDELSHVPSVAVGRLKNLPGVPSGVALKVAERPLMAKTLQKRALRESIYVKLCQHILELAGYGVDRKITVQWPEMMPSDDLVEAQVAAIWTTLGVSDDTLMQRGGFDPEVERQKKQDEAAAALKAQQEQMASGMMPGMAPGLAPAGIPNPAMQPQAPASQAKSDAAEQANQDNPPSASKASRKAPAA